MKNTNAVTPVIFFFDGYCNLCNRGVDFVVRYGNPETIKVASLQGQAAKKLLDLSTIPDSMVVLTKTQLLLESDAAIFLGKCLGGPFKLFALIALFAQLFPRPLRNFLYRFIAKNRYRLFGKSSSCRLATPKDKQFFLE